MSKKRAQPTSGISRQNASDSSPTNDVIRIPTPVRENPSDTSEMPLPSGSTSRTCISPSNTMTKKRKRGAPPRSNVEVSLEQAWPDHFKNLQRVYQALNTVFTFCSSRKHIHTTVDNMRTSIEGLLNAPLELESIAEIKTLLPLLVRFVYVKREDLGALEKLSTKHLAKKKDFAIYDLPDHQSLANHTPTNPSPDDEVLLFQFIDGELKTRPKSNLLSTSQASSSTRKNKFVAPRCQVRSPPLSLKELLMPSYTPKGMTKIIEQRNLKFKEAVDELLSACGAHESPVDAVQILIESSVDHMPRPSNESQDQQRIQDDKQRLEHYLEHPEDRPDIQTLLSQMKQDVHYRDQIVTSGYRITPPKLAIFGELEHTLSTTLTRALFETKQITSLFSHQAEAINHLSHGRDVIVSTSTSSGKSIVYQIPMLQALEKEQSACGLYIFPTKALAQDQKRSLQDLLTEFGPTLSNIHIATFDGDTPRADRISIRERANIIFTNPDMLHLTILPHEQLWRRLFQNLKFVVVDELHIYSGLFGAHMSFIMRRLRRICEAVGNESVQFVSCSATIENPIQHMKTIFNLHNVHLVSEDGSPSGAKHHIIWNPPLVDVKDISQGRLSPISEASRIFCFLIGNGLRTIVFCKIRKSCELMIRQVKEELVRENRQDLISRVKSYRSGYTAQERRAIEQEMYSGELLGIVATTALELGVDIGSLDATLTMGFPHSLSGLRQQAGRAGRRNKESLSILILDHGPSNQHFANHPDDLYDAPHTQICLDLENENIVAGHLQCAADEIPIQPTDDQRFFDDDLPSFCRTNLIEDKYGYFHPHPRFQPSPAQHVSIRKNEEVAYSIIDVSQVEQPKILEEMESSRVMYECYEGAVYIHQGRTFQVIGVDHTATICKLREVTVDYLTRPRELNELDAMRTFRIRAIPNSSSFACYGTVKTALLFITAPVTSTVYGYLKVDRRQNVLDSYDLEADPLIRNSRGVWLDVPMTAINTLRKYRIHLPTAIHAAEHALLNLAGDDLRVHCSGYENPFSSSSSDRPKRSQPARLILFDNPSKSGGVSIRAFDQIHDLLGRVIDLLDKCDCEDGCRSCLLARSMCSNGALTVKNAKFGVKVVLNSLVGQEWRADDDDPYGEVSSKESLVLTEPVSITDSVVVMDCDGQVLEPDKAAKLLDQYHHRC